MKEAGGAMNLIDMVQADPELSALWPKLKTGRHLVTGLSGSAKTVFFWRTLAAAKKAAADCRK